jgi:hypothetical protein
LLVARVGWMKQRSVLRVLCDCKTPTKLKRKFCKTAIRPTMLNDTRRWTVKK